MRIMLATTAVAAALGIGLAAGRVTPALAADEHANWARERCAQCGP